MSDDAQSRQIRFEIIKCLYGVQAIRKKPKAEFRYIAGVLKILEHQVTQELRILVNSDYVGIQNISHLRFAYLKPNAFNAMDRKPQPTTYDAFLERINDTQKSFSEPIKKGGLEGSFWEEHSILKKITPLGSSCRRL